MKIPFIDIHTHRSMNADGVIAVRSYFLQDIDLTDAGNHPFSAGIHPWHAQKVDLKEASLMLEKLIDSKSCIAIGETGLDKMCSADYQLQKELFGLHLEFAEAHNKPLIIHAVKSWNDLIPILKRAKVPCILHGYSEGILLTRQLIGLGCYFSIGKSVLQLSPRIQEAIRVIPLTSIFSETDEALVPIEEIYLELSKILNLDLNSLKIQIDQNFKNLISDNTEKFQG